MIKYNFTVEIAGQLVEMHIKERFPIEEFFGIFTLLEQIDQTDIRTEYPLITSVLKSWSFSDENEDKPNEFVVEFLKRDPSDKESYKDLDVFEVAQIGRNLIDHMQERAGSTPKN